MNKVLMSGRFTADPEIKYSQGQNPTAVARFRIAVERRGTKEPQADFFQCVAFGKTAEFCEKYLKKGTKVILSGKLQAGEYVNKEGQKVSAVEIVADDIEFAESKKAETATPQQAGMPVPQQGMQVQQAYQAPPVAQQPYGQVQPAARQAYPQGQPPIYVGADEPGFIPPGTPIFQ